MSERQNEANQQNALLSTGHKSDVGKETVSQNAVKHGIFSQEVVISQRDGKENQNEYELLILQLNDTLQPIGKLEELLVEKIGVNYWRMRRLMRYETEQISDNMDDFKTSIIENYYTKDDFLDKFYKQTVPVQPPMEYYNYSDYISKQALLKHEQKINLLEEKEFDFTNDEVFIKYVLE